MKTTLKIIQYKDGTWGAKKKNCFGNWKYFNHNCVLSDGFAITNYDWESLPPQRLGCQYNHNDKFISKLEMVKFLHDKYHSYRLFEEKE